MNETYTNDSYYIREIVTVIGGYFIKTTYTPSFHQHQIGLVSEFKLVLR